MRKQLLFTTAVLLFLILGTVIVVLYGRGYTFDFSKGKIDLSGTGLLVTTSTPDGASVYVNDHLTTATDNTINLAPGDYSVRIEKDGYFPWQKNIHIEKEVVAKADALLFPKAPSIESLTSEGVQNPRLDPSQTRIAYTVASESAKKNGIYVFDMSARPVLTLQSASIQIVDESIDRFSDATLSWSPDGKELVATIAGELRGPTTYLLDATRFNASPQDVTNTLYAVQARWQALKTQKEQARIAGLKKTLQKQLKDNFTILAWSPDDSKILYTASRSATLPVIIKPRLIGVDSTKENRKLEKGNLYVYDIKEDRNYPIDLFQDVPAEFLSPPIQWFPDSKHLIAIKNNQIQILEYDSGNPTTIYAGPFVDHSVFPWPNTSKIVILTHLGNPTIPANLYTIDLK